MTWISGKPASAMVGTSGSAADRLAPVTASARSLLLVTSGTAGASAPNEIGVCPPRVEVIASPPPLNGTCTTSSFSVRRNSSPTRSGGVPVPGEA